MLNINKLFSWLSIRSKLIIAFAGLSVIPLALIGVEGIFSKVEMMKTIAFENLTHDVHSIRENTSNFLASVGSDLRLLQNSSALQRYVKKHGTSSGGVAKEPLRLFADELLLFARSRGIYYQLRMVDASGDEVVRIESIRDSVAQEYRIVPEEELRHGRESFYFLLVENSGKDQIAYAPAELVKANNERVAVISVALSIVGKRGREGILIANVFARELFRAIETERHLTVEGKVVLVNSDGNYLYHSEKKKDWNRLLASREEDNLQHDYPPAIVASLLSGDQGIIMEGIDEIIAYAPLVSYQLADKGDATTANFSMPFYIFESVREDVILGPARSLALNFATFLVLFLLTAIGLGLLATRQFTKPIAALQRGAEIIAKGSYQHRLSVETHDEIEKLAEQFNAMAAALELHDREIQQHRLKLEEMVKLRTQELTEEKTKLQAILDNVPSAFVLLDKDYRIQTASATFGAVTGFVLEDVRGKDCASIFCNEGFCKHCVSRQAVASGQIASHVDSVVNGKLGERFIEHIAIPMKDNGEITSILEIITDITQRKQLEQQLIRTERLAAAGELSALIAHEFRNSLTSVKMILQLQKELKSRSASERRSLGVALNSIDHMERVVKELLNFARPSPLEFRTERLSMIINESVKFVEPHISKQHIQMRKSVDAALAPMPFDVSRFEEVLVNILLNAIQAIQSKPSRRNTEEIFISAKKGVLRKPFRDIVYPVSTDATQKKVSEQRKEIVLRRGMKCVMIEIRDTGPGIPRNVLRRIFDPFFTTKTNGTGLGLPMVKQVIHAHGGIIEVKTSKGRGASFRIYLPYAEKV